ncbi:type II secretion system protein GspL [Cocleimonas sp. KMM 6892]|uniref:type II secretion system protein GspL n=1 Tax=unclassified Cocleimonas TaxID=2639732 RepID=UPI002DBA0D86|nr:MULTISPECIES: type II secretion system protein GspL [unclassified Cocleimonas]MEB8432381.1 type II secretion system protein GspL [Cocleimonas sp. KMM 6892]MEC4715240.1 type II secretion system protein GspL [Cocleimonas sp. KMM 6895]MEC4745141.1 type II secretion system protein GspL [Cocleimonas sp. KMM 6896]
MQLLVIKLKASGSTPEYSLLGKKQASGNFIASDWKQIRSLTRGRRVVALIPANDVVITSVNIPSKNKKQLLQAIPFSLEDSLADDIEDLHFAVKQDDTSNHSQVAIIKRSTLEKHLDTFQEHGITAHFMLPETLGQYYRKDEWSIIFNTDQESATIRLGELEGFTCDDSMLDIFLAKPLENNKPKKIFSNKDKSNLPESLQQQDIEPISANTIDYESIYNALPLNLITNFSRQSNKSTINWSVWRPTIILAGLLASVWAGVFFWQNNLLQQQSQLLNQKIEQVYKSSFPKGRIVDPSVQMKAALDKLKENAGRVVDSPLPLISDLSPLLKEYKDMSLSEINYKENELTLVMQSPSLTRLETFKRDAAEKVKLKVDIKSSTTTSNKVEATLIISPLMTSSAKDVTPNNLPRGNS